MRTALVITIGIGTLAYALSLHLFPRSTAATYDLPTFTFTATDGNTHNSHDFKDKIVLLNFWASWCAPCVKEFPNLIKAAQEYPDDITLIALSSDFEAAQMNAFIKKQKYPAAPNILIAHDPDQAITETQFAVTALPITKIYNRTTLSKEIKGGDWTYETLNEHIKLLLGTNKKDS